MNELDKPYSAPVRSEADARRRGAAAAEAWGYAVLALGLLPSIAVCAINPFISSECLSGGDCDGSTAGWTAMVAAVVVAVIGAPIASLALRTTPRPDLAPLAPWGGLAVLFVGWMLLMGLSGA